MNVKKIASGNILQIKVAMPNLFQHAIKQLKQRQLLFENFFSYHVFFFFFNFFLIGVRSKRKYIAPAGSMFFF